MAFNIKEVIVDKISLITRGKKPAVPKAETRFSIFKSANKSILSEENKTKLDKISKEYENIEKATTTHTLLFDKKKFTKEEALKWAKDHNFKYNTIRETTNQWRVRQIAPEKFNQDSFRTIKLKDGVESVIGVLL